MSHRSSFFFLFSLPKQLKGMLPEFKACPPVVSLIDFVRLQAGPELYHSTPFNSQTSCSLCDFQRLLLSWVLWWPETLCYLLLDLWYVIFSIIETKLLNHRPKFLFFCFDMSSRLTPSNLSKVVGLSSIPVTSWIAQLKSRLVSLWMHTMISLWEMQIVVVFFPYSSVFFFYSTGQAGYSISYAHRHCSYLAQDAVQPPPLANKQENGSW